MNDNLDLNSIRTILSEIKNEEEQFQDARANFMSRSSVHKAAAEIIDFERKKFYNSGSGPAFQKKIKEIISKHAADIVNNETN